MLLLLEKGVSRLYFESFCRKICLFSPPSFTYSVIYLYESGLMDIYFRLWVIIQYCIIYFLAQTLPALAIGSSLRLGLMSL